MRRQLFVGVCLLAVCGLSRPAFAESHGYLGVIVGIDKERERGPTIQFVYPDSPAAKVGLKEGDRIMKVGALQPTNIEDFLKAVASYKPREMVTLVIQRDGKLLSTTAKVGEGPPNETTRWLGQFSSTSAHGSAYLGITMKLVKPELQRQARIGVEVGVFIMDIIPNSPADKAGLEPGDVITAAANKLVRSPEDLLYLVEQCGVGKEMPLTVIRFNDRSTYKAVLEEYRVPSYYGGSAIFPPDVNSLPADPSSRIRDLEYRIAELERRLEEERRR